MDFDISFLWVIFLLYVAKILLIDTKIRKRVSRVYTKNEYIKRSCLSHTFFTLKIKDTWSQICFGLILKNYNWDLYNNYRSANNKNAKDSLYKETKWLLLIASWFL